MVTPWQTCALLTTSQLSFGVSCVLHELYALRRPTQQTEQVKHRLTNRHTHTFA